ncbi:MAG: hypothetical protein NC181_05610, partial [Clostridium sp.]|nr:hypothetical protein [Clostridium sp.]MCM1444714.1 hypothetical protein [Candidatus Amulumruptor caecigallinarius]
NECTYTSNGVCENGNYVYFNPTTGAKCAVTDYTDSQSATGVNSGCMKWYVFNDSSNSNKVNLLLDHNTTNSVQYNNSGVTGPINALAQLKSDTSSWTGVETPTNYTFTSVDRSSGEGQTQGSQFTYTIDYSGYKARLITANEIAQITGDTNFNESDLYGVTSYFFNSKSSSPSSTCTSGNTTECKYGWLYDRTSTTCETWGCLNNADSNSPSSMYIYFTATAHSYYQPILGVHGTGQIMPVNGTGAIRPVIEVSKSKL